MASGGRRNVGIGLRAPHVAPLLAERPALDFLEVHSENCFADGGAALGMLDRVRERWPISLHGVGLGLGSAIGLDPWHLDRLARLVDRVAPVRVSDHACFGRASGPGGAVHAADLLPIGFNETTLALTASNVARVQERIGRPILVENLAESLSFEDDTMAEAGFFAALCKVTGCGVLLDLNNLMVRALNAGATDPLAACL